MQAVAGGGAPAAQEAAAQMRQVEVDVAQNIGKAMSDIGSWIGEIGTSTDSAADKLAKAAGGIGIFNQLGEALKKMETAAHERERGRAAPTRGSGAT